MQINPQTLQALANQQAAPAYTHADNIQAAKDHGSPEGATFAKVYQDYVNENPGVSPQDAHAAIAERFHNLPVQIIPGRQQPQAAVAPGGNILAALANQGRAAVA